MCRLSDVRFTETEIWAAGLVAERKYHVNARGRATTLCEQHERPPNEYETPFADVDAYLVRGYLCINCGQEFDGDCWEDAAEHLDDDEDDDDDGGDAAPSWRAGFGYMYG